MQFTTDSRPLRWLLMTIVCALASVTAISVGMAMAALINDPRLAALFGGAGVLLDAFKYLAWPLALAVLACGRRALAVLMMACATVLGGVSGWATYDRLMTAMSAGRAEQAAVLEQRITDLQQAHQLDSLRMQQIGQQEAQALAAVAALRDRGMVSKAQEAEHQALQRLDAERTATMARLDAASQELTALRASTGVTATLPQEVATLLCLGFAAALEVVPALLLAVLRGVPAPAVSVPVVEERQVTAQQVEAETGEDNPPADVVAALLHADDAGLLQLLLERIEQCGQGTSVAVRKFAREMRIGNERAQRIIQAAVRMGRVEKTQAGYVTA